MAVMNAAFRSCCACIAPPIDAVRKPDFNSLNVSFLALFIEILSAHLVDLLHLAILKWLC